VEDLFDEVVGLMPVGPVALQTIEQGVKPLGNGARLRFNEILFHRDGLQI
jgi:hypothetical protein